MESAINARRSAEQEYGVVYKERSKVWVPRDYENKLSPQDVVNLSEGNVSEALAVKWLRCEPDASISVKMMLNLMRDVLGFERIDHITSGGQKSSI